jgi:hypothetical protein
VLVYLAIEQLFYVARWSYAPSESERIERIRSNWMSWSKRDEAVCLDLQPFLPASTTRYFAAPGLAPPFAWAGPVFMRGQASGHRLWRRRLGIFPVNMGFEIEKIVLSGLRTLLVSRVSSHSGVL